MTKEAAQELIHLMKQIINTGDYYLPERGTQNKIPLQSVRSSREHFQVIVNRAGKINKEKYTLLLHHPSEGLLRIDVSGRPHTNPGSEKPIPCPHIHMRVKDEGPWDQWAFELPAVFGNTDDCITTLRDFLQYCQVNNIQEIKIYEQREII